MHNLCSEFAEQLRKKHESPIKESNQSSEINIIDTDTESMIKQCHEYSVIGEPVDLTELGNSELIINVPYPKWSRLFSIT